VSILINFDEVQIKYYSEIESDFEHALTGIFKLPVEAQFGVYTAYKYYTKLLKKLKKTPFSTHSKH